MAEYIYSMVRARKAVGEKLILDDVTMAFLPGREDRHGRPQRRRKVHDPQDHGRARHPVATARRSSRPGFTRRHPDAGARARRDARPCSRTCRRASARSRPSSTASTRSRWRWPSPTPTSTRCSPRWARCRRRSTPPTPGTSTPSSSRRWTRCAPRRATPASRTSPVVRSAASRSPSCCCRSPTCCCSTSPPTTSTPRACSGSSSTSQKYPGAVIADHPRPVLPRQRRRVDRRGRPRPPHRLRGQLLDLPREEGRAPRRPGQEGREARQAPRRRARVGAQQRQGPPDQVEGAPRALRGDGGRGRPHPQARLRRDPDPAGPAPRAAS